MKRIIGQFIFRGFVACGFGPLVLATIYAILNVSGVVHTVTVDEMTLGIFSISALAFVVGGMNVLYSIERIPLMVAIFIHGGVLYVSYLATYLINGWLELTAADLLGYSAIFVVAYLAVWVVIYTITRVRTRRVNEVLKLKQNAREEK